MKKDNPSMEDDLRPEYDLKSLKVRKFGSERRSFSGKVINNIENEIDSLIGILEKLFISKRNKFQEKTIFLMKTKDWKKYQKYFNIFMYIFLVLFGVLLRFSVILSKRDDVQSLKFMLVTSLFSSLFFLLAATICLAFYQFTWIFDDFRTYQDELHSIKQAVKKNIARNNYLCKEDSKNISLFFLKSHFDYRIKKIENGLKVVDPVSYMYAIFLILVILLIFGFPKPFDSLLRDSKNYSLLLGFFLFAVAFVQSLLKTVAYKSGYSQIGKHQECLLLLEEIEMMSGSIEAMNSKLNQSGIAESK